MTTVENKADEATYPCISIWVDIVLEGAGSNSNIILMTQVNTDIAKQSVPAICNEVPNTLFNKNSFDVESSLLV